MLIPSDNPILHTGAREIEADEFGPELHALCDVLAIEMVNRNAIGLAAPQVGISQQIFVMRVPMGDLRYVINPRIVERSETEKTEMEGCLSYPDYIVPVSRPAEVVVSYFTPEGEEVTAHLEQLEARCFQHEFDHLLGICFVDGLSTLKLESARRRAAKARRRK